MTKELKNDITQDQVVNSSNKQTPEWLKALEAQSWQAELIISGLGAATLIRLPNWLLSWGEQYMISSSELGSSFLSMSFLFALCGVNILLVCFGIHFIFRSIWIALLGLNSVFPEGINVDSDAGAGPAYWKKTKEMFPNLSKYNQELDNRCSLIFSIAAGATVILTSFSVFILILYVATHFLIAAFPEISKYLVTIGITLYITFLLVSTIPNFFAKKYPNNKKLEKFTHRFGNIVNGMFSLYIFKKPLNYILGILTSNTSTRNFFIISIFLGFIMGILAGKQSDAYLSYDYMRANRYFSFNDREHISIPLNYENLHPQERRIFTPIIPNKYINSTYLSVFIPIISREKEHIKLEEPSLLQKFSLSDEERDGIAVKNLNEYIQFNQITINNQVITEKNATYYNHPNHGEAGILMNIPTKGFLNGKNILQIKKDYYSDDGIQKIVTIPFYFTPTISVN